jgi:hypothetical protein
MRIVPICDIVPARYRKRVVDVWEHMTHQQKVNLYYGIYDKRNK